MPTPQHPDAGAVRPRPPLTRDRARLAARPLGLTAATAACAVVTGLAGVGLLAGSPAAAADTPAPAPSVAAASPVASAPGTGAATSRALQADDRAWTPAFAAFLRAPQDAAARTEATEAFTRLSAAHPEDLSALACLGALTALSAQDTWLPWRKMARAEDGLALLDRALARLPGVAAGLTAAPAHQGVPAPLQVRLVAARTFLALPAMFHRQERGQALIEQLAADPALDRAPAPFRAEAWLQVAHTRQAAGQSAAARQALDRLQTLTGTPQQVQADKLRREWSL